MWVYLNISFSPPSLPLLFPFSSSLLFSALLSGRATSEGPIQYSLAPTQTDVNSSYNSESICNQGSPWKDTVLCACGRCKNSAMGSGRRGGEGLLTRTPSDCNSSQVFNASLKALGKPFLKVRERADMWGLVQFTDAVGCRSWILLRENWPPRMLKTLRRLEKKTLEAMHKQGPPLNCHLPALVVLHVRFVVSDDCRSTGLL